MILRVPSYYKEFHCIADACKDSCCISWEIDIDEDTFDYYKSIEGEFGKRLRSHMVSEDVNSFVLEKNGWCPFLNEKKLCDICIELGEEALSEVCTEYPRFTVVYGNVMEKALSLSCEEASRILFTQEKQTTFVDFVMPDGWEDDEDEEEADEELSEFREHLEENRDEAIRILQSRELPLGERVAQYLHFCEEKQQVAVDDRLQEEMDPEQDLWNRVTAFRELEVLNHEWPDALSEMRTFFETHSWKSAMQEYGASEDYREDWYEELLVYFTFRYFMKSWYDGNLLTKAQFAVACTVMIRDLDVVRYFQNGKHFSLADRIDVARIFSKEVEHSEANLDLLEEDMVFEEEFYVGHLAAQMEV